jgi:hypothetical protein
VNSQGKIDHNRKDFLDIGKQMLETSYTLKSKQLLKIAPELKLKTKKT